MGRRIIVTEYLEMDIDESQWHCSRCDKGLIDAQTNYKKGCLVYGRDPRDIHNPVFDAEYNFAPDPDWVRIIEFYCPECGTQIETEYLPLGHPITHDIEIDVESLKARLDSGELIITDKRLEVRT
ncbi:MAG: acetone carboxylase subunit gamma [SAR324 cluster bacterium]|jgi:acetophenone carboxylase|nr:acetone carboxylase subunit gamma [SAR324 cluster bacterium]HCV46021.1 acetophenone carboxylase [Deltaproteobacteria bacterium]MDP7171267.1 acetone carboxylase subunit gamma [SAR324 cluster bacterium]MDP7176521.1 acetone carboxylase subunit gamma [SAR324 cluster bacterium]MDP7438573.1 acetone carboxylase subunit gamma [SAR324 cluster bacterium]|tara:strand:- start:1031 stop:1405 length:375 start_codon:yes stop_codon:yes gene_type:complete